MNYCSFARNCCKKKVRTLVALPQKHFLYTVKVRKSSDVLLACIIRIGEVRGCYSKLHVSESTQCLAVCKNIHREKAMQVMIMSPSVTFFQKSIIIMRAVTTSMYCFSDTAIFNFQLFFFEHNHNNRK